MKRDLAAFEGDVRSVSDELKLKLFDVIEGMGKSYWLARFARHPKTKGKLAVAAEMLRDLGWGEVGVVPSAEFSSLKVKVPKSAWDGLCPAKLHGLDREGQTCDLCPKKLKFRDYPQFPHANYQVDIPWDYVESWLKGEMKEAGLNLDPDFQRAHVWTEEQQRAYVDHCLRGGEVGRVLVFNADQWPSPGKTFELVDGKQRLEAVRKFLRGELTVRCFACGGGGSIWENEANAGKGAEVECSTCPNPDFHPKGWLTFGDFEGRMPIDLRFQVRVCKLETRADVLKLYLSMNAGGTPHSVEEISKVREMLKKEEE